MDLCFANCADVDLIECYPLYKLDVYHPPFTVTVDALQCAVSLDDKYCYRDFKNTNYVEINSYLFGIDWLREFRGLEVDGVVGTFYGHVNAVINMFVSFKYKVHTSYQQWFSKELINLIKLKKTAHKLYKRLRDHDDYLYFSRLRSLNCL